MDFKKFFGQFSGASSERGGGEKGVVNPEPEKHQELRPLPGWTVGDRANFSEEHVNSTVEVLEASEDGENEYFKLRVIDTDDKDGLWFRPGKILNIHRSKQGGFVQWTIKKIRSKKDDQ